MREGKLLNGKYYLSDISLNLFKKNKCYGFSKFFIGLSEQRCELFKEFNFNKYKITHWLIFYNFFYNILPQNKIINKNNIKFIEFF